MAQKLELLSASLKRIPEVTRPTHTTAWRWGKKYPGLVVMIGGRLFGRPACWDAIASGMSLADAARLGDDDD